MAANKKKLIVYTASDGELRVQPPVIDLDFADTNGPEQLVIRNLAGEDLVMYVGANAFGANPVGEPILKGARVTKPVVTQGAGVTNTYALQLFGAQSGKKAKGNSDPVIIVEN